MSNPLYWLFGDFSAAQRRCLPAQVRANGVLKEIEIASISRNFLGDRNPFRTGHVSLAHATLNEVQQEISHGLAGVGEREIGRMDERAGEVDRWLDQQRLCESGGSEVRHIADRQDRAADFVSDSPHFAGQRISFQHNVRCELRSSEYAINQGAQAVGGTGKKKGLL